MTALRLPGRAALLALVAGALLAPALALPAQAHEQLVSSVPAEGEVLSELPPQIVLEFTNALLDATPAVLIRDAADTTVYEATPTVSDRVATAPFPALSDGTYHLNWSVVSADGHRIEGSVSFELATGLAGDDGATFEAAPAASSPGAGATSSSVDTTAAATPALTPTATPSAEGGASGLSNLPTAAKVAIGVGGVGAVAAVIGAMLRARRGGIRGQ